MDQAVTRPAPFIRRAIRKISDILAECAYAQRRMNELATAPDRYVFNPERPPETYDEFLYRTSGVLRREPSAAARARASR